LPKVGDFGVLVGVAALGQYGLFRVNIFLAQLAVFTLDVERGAAMVEVVKKQGLGCDALSG